MLRMQRGEVRGGMVCIDGKMVRDAQHDAVIAEIMAQAFGRKSESVCAVVAESTDEVEGEESLHLSVPCDPVSERERENVLRIVDFMGNELDTCDAIVATSVVSVVSTESRKVALTDACEPVPAWYGPVDQKQSDVLRSTGLVKSVTGTHMTCGGYFGSAYDVTTLCSAPPDVSSATRDFVIDPGKGLPSDGSLVREQVIVETARLVDWWVNHVLVRAYELYSPQLPVAAAAVHWYGERAVECFRDQTCLLPVFNRVMSGLVCVSQNVEYPGKDPDWFEAIGTYVGFASTVALADGYQLPWDWYVRHLLVAKRRLWQEDGYRESSADLLVYKQWWPFALDVLPACHTLRHVLMLDHSWLRFGENLMVIRRHTQARVKIRAESDVQRWDWKEAEVYLFTEDMPDEILDLRIMR